MTYIHAENVVINQSNVPPFTGQLLDVQLAGASKVSIDQDGRVGVGTTAPTHALTFPLGSAGIALYDTADQVTNYRRGFIKWDGPFMVGTEKAPGATGRTLDLVGSGVAFRPTGDGVTRTFLFGTAGHFLANADNTYDIGAAGVNRPRDLFLGRNAVVGGNINSSGGTIQTAGQPRIDNGGNLINVGNVTFSGSLTGSGGFQETPVPPELGWSVDGNGNIRTNGNLQVRRNDDSSTGPTLMYMGRQGLQDGVPAHTNYFFWESRLNKNGWYWGGWNTFRHPNTYPQRVVPPDPPVPSVEVAYGYYPFRNLAKHYLLEADGTITTDNALVGPTVYFQRPKRTDLWDGIEKDPYVTTINYDSDRHPYIDLGQQTTLAAPFPGEDATQITVTSSTGFAVHDEILIDGTAPGGQRSEINEIETIAGTTWTLKRGTKRYDSGTVKKVRELGGVRTSKDPGGAGLSTYITRVKTASPAQDYLILYDAETPAGKRLATLVTGVANNVKVDRGESSGTFTIPANSNWNAEDPPGTPIQFPLNTSFSSGLSYQVVPIARNVTGASGVTLVVRDRFPGYFTLLGRNNHPTNAATFYVSWLAIGV